MNDELERLMREATEHAPLPWYSGESSLRDADDCKLCDYLDPPQAALICAAVNALPELLAERAENARLREALQPFIRSEDDFKGAPDNAPYGVYVKIRDLRRARAALNQETKQGDNGNG